MPTKRQNIRQPPYAEIENALDIFLRVRIQVMDGKPMFSEEVLQTVVRGIIDMVDIQVTSHWKRSEDKREKLD